MNLSMNDVRTHLTTWLNWWLGGWQDAWAMLPKPAALQTRPEVFRTAQGGFLAHVAKPGEKAVWQTVNRPDVLQGIFIDDESVLLRELSLPLLGERDITAAVAMDVQTASPFPAHDTRYGYSTHRQLHGALSIDIAITRQSHLEQLQAQYPQHALFARGERGAIPLHNGNYSQQSAWYRSPLTLSLSTLLGLVLLAWIISPTLLLRAQAQAHEAALAKLNREAAPLMQKREELSALQQQLENAHIFNNEHPDPAQLIEQLSAHIPDSTWITQLNLRKDQLALEGSSDNAIAIVSLLEKTPSLNEVRLGASVNRDPRSGRENFQILARIQASAPAPISASGTKP